MLVCLHINFNDARRAKDMANRGKGAIIVTGVRPAMDRALKPVLDRVNDNVPVVTGATKANIKIRAGKGRRGVVRREIRVGDKQMPGGFPAAFVEFGAKNAPPHPFMGPAFESEGDHVRDRAEREILAGIEREASN
jgi:HK97 gp10 family phage protein